MEGEAEVVRLPFGGARARGVVYLLAGGIALLVLFGGLDLSRQFAVALRGGGGSGAVLAVLAMGSIVLAWSGVRSLLGREEWRVGDNYLEIRDIQPFLSGNHRHVGCRLVVRGAGRSWSLVMERKGRRHCLAYAMKPVPALGLGHMLSRSTGWPLKVSVELGSGWLSVDVAERLLGVDRRQAAREKPSCSVDELAYLRLERAPGRSDRIEDAVIGVLAHPRGEGPAWWLYAAERGEGVEGWKDAYYVMTAWSALIAVPVRDDSGVDHWKQFGPEHVVSQAPPHPVVVNSGAESPTQ